MLLWKGDTCVIDAPVITCLLPLVMLAVTTSSGTPAGPSAVQASDKPPARVAADMRALDDALRKAVVAATATLPDDPRHPPRVAVSVIDVRRGVSVGVDAHRPMYLASGVKLFLLVELYRQRAARRLSFDEQLPYGDDDVRDGAPTLNKLALGSRFSVETLIRYMIRDSDNAAFDLLLRRAGQENVEALARSYGPMGAIVSTLETRRAVYSRLDGRARQLDAAAIRDVRWRDGWHPRLDLLKQRIGPPFGAYDVDDYDRAWAEHYETGASSAPLITPARLLRALARGKAVSPEADAEILSLLRHVATSDRRIAGALAEDVVVAHKTGSLHKRLCDLGVITLPDGSPLVVTVGVTGASYDRAEAAVALVARAAFDAAVENRKLP